MLGRLLNTAASSLNPAAYSSRNASQLESVTEEEHTAGLLFPDASLLRQSNTDAYPLQTAFNSPNALAAGAYDDRGGLELDPAKDFRVIIAQNALGDRDACVLLDTCASAESSILGLGLDPQMFDSSAGKHNRTMSSISRGQRRSNVPKSHNSLNDSIPFSTTTDATRSSPASPGAFFRSRGRSSTMSPSGGHHDTYNSRQAADSSDSGLLNCIFGSSAFSYRGSSTKMHIISADEATGKNIVASPATTQTESENVTHGRAARSPLPRAHTTGSSSDLLSSSRRFDSKPPAKVTVLLTRMFSVNLPETGESPSDQHDYANSVYQESLPETGFPFPDIRKPRKVREKKTPMYAVAITLKIPVLSRYGGRPTSRFNPQSLDSPKFAMSCSLDSDHRSRSAFLEDSLSLASPPAGLDERIDLLVDHWDVITRSLSHLERLARREILFLLKKVDSLSGPHPKPAKAPNMQRTNQTIVHLPANILAVNPTLKDECIRSTRRISLALQMPYVVTGQSRWGVWREEGRSILRSLGDKEHSFFFLVLITAFLGNHTEWLNVLGPDWYRRRHFLQQKAHQDVDPLVTRRTVIISSDKMTSRRLIFLLSAFLPAKQRFELAPSLLRPGTSTSMRAMSHSPPTVPVLRQESLRRAIERRSRAQRLNLPDHEMHHRSVSVSSSDTAYRFMDGSDQVTPASLSARRGSEAHSMKNLSIPLNPKDGRTTQVSAATTSTVTPSATVPVPHFAPLQKPSTRDLVDSSLVDATESAASENLLRSLQRSGSSAMGTNNSLSSGSGRWGSLFSGLWSSRQETSVNENETTTASESSQRSVSAMAQISRKDPPTLRGMVKEVAGLGPGHFPEPVSSENISIPTLFDTQHAVHDDSPASQSSGDHIRESALKFSVRPEDGVVDVDLPLPGFVSLSSSGESTAASPKKSRTSFTSVDALGSTHSSNSGFCLSRENDGPNINVAGWLRAFHEDFLLQAVRPYNGLEADIKRAMQAEATPHITTSYQTDSSDRWVDVATTLIADTRTFTVKRLRLRRMISLGHGYSQTPPSSGQSHPPTPRNGSENQPAMSPFTAFLSNPTSSSRGSLRDSDVSHVEEKFVEESLMDLDGTLVDAVERVLARSGQSSLAHSRAPSPSRNKNKSASESAARDNVPAVEVPRTECRKMVLGALEEVVRSVTAEHCRDDGDGEVAGSDREPRRALTGFENTLREGVRKWLLDVEEIC